MTMIIMGIRVDSVHNAMLLYLALLSIISHSRWSRLQKNFVNLHLLIDSASDFLDYLNYYEQIAYESKWFEKVN